MASIYLTAEYKEHPRRNKFNAQENRRDAMAAEKADSPISAFIASLRSKVAPRKSTQAEQILRDCSTNHAKLLRKDIIFHLFCGFRHLSEADFFNGS
jgi:hypothetical protein